MKTILMMTLLCFVSACTTMCPKVQCPPEAAYVQGGAGFIYRLPPGFFDNRGNWACEKEYKEYLEAQEKLYKEWLDNFRQKHGN